jgi:predicted Zn-dependent peptidase
MADLITDVLSGGGSSRLFQKLVKEKQLFSSIDCYHLGSTDAGLLVISGKLIKGVDIDKANEAIEEEIDYLKFNGVTELELEKVKNKTESAMAFEDMSLMNRAASLANYEMLGNANLINLELQKYQDVTCKDLLLQSNIIFDKNNCNTLYYQSKN